MDERRSWLSAGEEMLRWPWRDDSWKDWPEWKGPFMG
jgi:hypothetical protein